MKWVWDNRETVLELFMAHAMLSAPPIIISILAAIPLGWLAVRRRWLRRVLLAACSVVYTIPSLALLVVVPVLVGTRILDPNNVVLALSVYGIVIMLRSSIEGFESVPHPAQDVAESIGFSPVQRFLRIDLPLAGPVLLAGLRVMSVSTVSLVSIGALIGISSLGNLITNGFARNFVTEILTGVFGILVLAAMFDVLLVLLSRLLMPWSRKPSAPQAMRPEVAQP